MDNSKSTGYEVKRKNIALPYVVETYIYNLCILKEWFSNCIQDS